MRYGVHLGVIPQRCEGWVEDRVVVWSIVVKVILEYNRGVWAVELDILSSSTALTSSVRFVVAVDLEVLWRSTRQFSIRSDELL